MQFNQLQKLIFAEITFKLKTVEMFACIQFTWIAVMLYFICATHVTSGIVQCITVNLYSLLSNLNKTETVNHTMYLHVTCAKKEFCMDITYFVLLFNIWACGLNVNVNKAPKCMPCGHGNVIIKRHSYSGYFLSSIPYIYASNSTLKGS